jgi:hypothetical protein
MLLATLAALVAAPAAPLPAQAEDPAGFDLRCLVTIAQAAESMPKDQADGLGLAMMFYAGRVDVTVAAEKLDARWTSAAKQVEGRPLAPIMQECGTFMESRGTAMVDLSKRLDAKK